MKIILKIMIFSILLNFSIGIMQTAIPAFDETKEYSAGLVYDPSYVDTFGGQYNTSVNAQAVTGGSIGTDEANLFDRLGFGYITKMMKVFDQYMFGFINVLHNIFGASLEPALRTILFNSLKSIMVIGYILTVFWLFTGKSVAGSQG